MGWELDRPLFRRLVQLYLFVFGISIVTLLLEFLDARWSDFSRSFDALVAERFATPYPVLEEAGLAVLLAVTVWHFVSAFGLLRFRNGRVGLLDFHCADVDADLPAPSKPIYVAPWSMFFSAAFEACLPRFSCCPIRVIMGPPGSEAPPNN